MSLRLRAGQSHVRREVTTTPDDFFIAYLIVRAFMLALVFILVLGITAIMEAVKLTTATYISVISVAGAGMLFLIGALTTLLSGWLLISIFYQTRDVEKCVEARIASRRHRVAVSRQRSE